MTFSAVSLRDLSVFYRYYNFNHFESISSYEFIQVADLGNDEIDSLRFIYDFASVNKII